MVNVTHDGHNRRTWFSLCFTHVTVVQDRFFQLVLTAQDNFVTHFLGNQLCGFLVNHLVDSRHGAHLHHGFNDLRTFHRHLVG